MSSNRLLVGIVLVAGMTAAGVSGLAEPTSTCQEALAWARARGDHLPTTLAAITRYPLIYRRAIFNVLSNEQRASLWQHRLRQIAAMPMTAEQTAVVQEAFAIVTPDLYRTQEIPADWLARARRHFSGASWQLLTDFSYSGPNSEQPLTRMAIGWCTCAHGIDPCSSGYVCCGWQANCDEWVGCGPFGQSLCDGKCKSSCPHP